MWTQQDLLDAKELIEDLDGDSITAIQSIEYDEGKDAIAVRYRRGNNVNIAYINPDAANPEDQIYSDFVSTVNGQPAEDVTEDKADEAIRRTEQTIVIKGETLSDEEFDELAAIDVLAMLEAIASFEPTPQVAQDESDRLDATSVFDQIRSALVDQLKEPFNVTDIFMLRTDEEHKLIRVLSGKTGDRIDSIESCNLAIAYYNEDGDLREIIINPDNPDTIRVDSIRIDAALNREDLEAIKEALEELYTDGIEAIQSAELRGEEIVGRFRDGVKIYNYTLNPDAANPVDQRSYVLANPNAVRDDEFEFVRNDAKNCKNSTPCGNSCISKSKTCRKSDPMSEKAKTKTKAVKEKLKGNTPKATKTKNTPEPKQSGRGNINDPGGAEDRSVLESNGVKGLDLTQDISMLKRLKADDPGDRAYREAILEPRNNATGQASSLDRIMDQRRLVARDKRLSSQEDIREAAGSFRQGMRSYNNSPGNLAMLEYTKTLYDGMTPAGRQVFARELGDLRLISDPQSRSPRFRDMMQDIERRQARIPELTSPSVSRGRRARGTSSPDIDDDNDLLSALGL